MPTAFVRALVATVALALAGFAGAATSSGPVPQIVTERCQVTVPRVRMECGQLLVRQDRTDPENTNIQRLSFAVLKAASADPAPDPLVFLTGGPGSSAFYFLPVVANSPIRRRRDIIVLEQRGNGYSSPNLLCDLGEPATPDALVAGFAACRAQVDARAVMVQPYDLSQSAADVAELRQALAIPQWNLFGTSYGSFWALRVLADHPQGLRSIILDSPFPPQASDKDEWVAQLNGLHAVFTACASHAPCAAAYPDLRQRFVGLIDQLDRQPLETPAGKVGATDVMKLVADMNFESATVHLVPRLIHALERLDLKDIERMNRQTVYPAPRGIDMRRVYSAGLNINIPCIDDVPFAAAPKDRLPLQGDWPESVQRVARDIAWDKDRICREAWPTRPSSTDMGAPVQSDLPALITVGAMDPSTPPDLGRQMASTLSNSSLAILPDSAHAALVRPSACVAGILTAFLDRPDQSPDLSCLSGDQPRFALPGDRITLPVAGR